MHFKSLYKRTLKIPGGCQQSTTSMYKCTALANRKNRWWISATPLFPCTNLLCYRTVRTYGCYYVTVITNHKGPRGIRAIHYFHLLSYERKVIFEITLLHLSDSYWIIYLACVNEQVGKPKSSMQVYAIWSIPIRQGWSYRLPDRHDFDTLLRSSYYQTLQDTILDNIIRRFRTRF